jgi:hypothetical protein
MWTCGGNYRESGFSLLPKFEMFIPWHNIWSIRFDLVAEKKTLLRTIRITQELEDLLQRDAKLKRISVNALISSIMTKYAEWDRFRERFDAIVITPRGLCYSW